MSACLPDLKYLGWFSKSSSASHNYLLKHSIKRFPIKLIDPTGFHSKE